MKVGSIVERVGEFCFLCCEVAGQCGIALPPKNQTYVVTFVEGTRIELDLYPNMSFCDKPFEELQSEEEWSNLCEKEQVEASLNTKTIYHESKT